jgi:hypothetical protein
MEGGAWCTTMSDLNFTNGIQVENAVQTCTPACGKEFKLDQVRVRNLRIGFICKVRLG